MVTLSVLVPALGAHSALLRRTVFGVPEVHGLTTEMIVVHDGRVAPYRHVLWQAAQRAAVIEADTTDEGEALNAALSQARGDYVGVLRPGSVYLDPGLSLIARELTAYPSDVLYGSCERVSIDGGTRSVVRAYPWDAKWAVCHATSPVHASAALVKRELLASAGAFSSGPAHLFDLWMRLWKAGARFDHHTGMFAQEITPFVGDAVFDERYVDDLVAKLRAATDDPATPQLAEWRHRAIAAAHILAVTGAVAGPKRSPAWHLREAAAARPSAVPTYAVRAAVAAARRRPNPVSGGPAKAGLRVGTAALRLATLVALGALAVDGLRTGTRP